MFFSWIHNGILGTLEDHVNTQGRNTLTAFSGSQSIFFFFFSDTM